MSGHTPGPWTVGAVEAQVFPLKTDSPVCGLLWPTGDRSEAETRANARLIAAAPELLAELQGAVAQMEAAAECIEAGRYDEALLHVRSLSRQRAAAIAKATA